MSGADKQYYDREDLDEEEQMLFDAMVLEEMEKLENQFNQSSINDNRREHNLPALQLNTLNDDMGHETRDQPQLYIRNDPPNLSQRSEQRYSDPSTVASSNGLNSSLSVEQPVRRAPRISLNADNLARSDQNGLTYSPGKSNPEIRQAQHEYKGSSDMGSRLAVPEPYNSSRRSRRGDISPDSRAESSMSRIGASDSSMVSPSQKRAQQAKYAMQLAEASAKSESYRVQESSISQGSAHSNKPSRRSSAEITIEENNVISSIGQDIQQLKERKKLLQLKYAQELSHQQSQRNFKNNSPTMDESPRGTSGRGYNSSRGQQVDARNYGDSSPAPSKSGVVNFGSDPDAEAAKKREMKAVYSRQLQEQQGVEMESKGYGRGNDHRNGGRSDGRDDGYTAYTVDDRREEERIAAISAAELKRLQQRQYHDEISQAAAATPISSARGPLKGAPQSRHTMQRRPSEDYGSYSAGAEEGTGLQLGTSSSFLTNADAERLESRSRKVQLQLMYAKQLSDDATASSAGSTRSGSTPTSRRGSLEMPHQPPRAESRGTNRPSSGSMGMSGADGRGIFDSMSEKDQSALAAAKKRASQMEYYQQLQEADNRRGDASVPSQSSRATLYRNREQREQEVPPIGGNSSYRQSSRSHSDHSLVESNGYQGYGSSLGAGPGLGAPAMPNSARRQQQDEYARALRSDAEAAPIADSYTAQRRSHHDREGPVNRAVSRDNGYTQERGQERETERYQEREPERYQERELDRYQEREPERYQEQEQERYSERGSGYDPSTGPPHHSGGYDRRSDEGLSDRGRSPRGGYPSSQRDDGSYDNGNGQYEAPRRGDAGGGGGGGGYSPSQSDQADRQYDPKKQYLFRSDPNGPRSQGAGQDAPGYNYGSGNLSHRSNVVPANARGRSSGGGASSISLY